MADQGHLLRDLPDAAGGEVVERLLASGDVEIERIVSRGQASPEGFWYDQPRGEWVLLVEGEAGLRFEDEADERVLGTGDWVWIEAGRRHRVITAIAVN